METAEIDYPDSDGMPMADNSRQFRWICTLMLNASILFKQRDDVFVAEDHLIYPVQGNPEVSIAPDAYVAFGVKKRDRGSYKVWEEHGIFPQVVFEVYSPGNTQREFEFKLTKYERFGAEEYYIIYPDDPATIVGYVRNGKNLVELETLNGFISPRLGISFLEENGDVTVIGPDGNPWLPLDDQVLELREERNVAQRQTATANRQSATNQRRAEVLAAEAAELREKNQALRDKLRAAGIDPDAD